MNKQDNTSLKDRGWEAMSILLDEKMPRKPRFIWIWWLIGLSFPMLILGVFAFHNKGETSLEKSKSSSIQTDLIALSSDDNQTTELIGQEELLPDSLSFKGIVTESSRLREGIRKQYSSVVQSDEDINLKKRHTSISNKYFPIETIANSHQKIESIHNNEAGLPAYKNNGITPILLIPNLPIVSGYTSADLVDDFNLSGPELNEFKQARMNIHLVVGATLYNSLYNIPGGFDFSAGLRKKLSKHWSIYAGINYSRYFRSGYDPIFRIASLNSSDTYFEDAKNLDYVNLDKSYASYEEAVPLVDRLDYLQVPIMINYHFHPKWAVGVGGRFAYLLNGRNKAGNNFAVNNALQEGLGVNDLLFEKQYYRNYDIAYGIELRYQISKAWSIGAHWNRGVLNILDVEQIQGSTQRKDFNRDLGLNISYTF